MSVCARCRQPIISGMCACTENGPEPHGTTRRTPESAPESDGPADVSPAAYGRGKKDYAPDCGAWDAHAPCDLPPGHEGLHHAPESQDNGDYVMGLKHGHIDGVAAATEKLKRCVEEVRKRYANHPVADAALGAAAALDALTRAWEEDGNG